MENRTCTFCMIASRRDEILICVDSCFRERGNNGGRDGGSTEFHDSMKPVYVSWKSWKVRTVLLNEKISETCERSECSPEYHSNLNH